MTTTNVVKVDYIEGEYDGRGDDGFAKRMPKGYSGGRRNRSVGDDDDDLDAYGDAGRSDQMGDGLIGHSGGQVPSEKPSTGAKTANQRLTDD